MLFLLNTKKNNRRLKHTTSVGLKKRLLRTVCVFALLCGAHIAAMQRFEHMSIDTAQWNTFTTVATVGYGDTYAKTLPGRISTEVLIYGLGIATMSQLIGLAIETSQLKKQQILTGKRKWKMNDHIVILNSPKNDAEGYFKKLMTEFRKSALPKAQLPAIIVSPDMDTISDEIRELHVGHVNEPLTSKTAFDKASVKDASVIVILSHDENDATSDSVTLDLVERARMASPDAQIIAEAISDDNKERLIKNGANHVIRPIRAYPEMVVRTILTPGAEAIIHEVFSTQGDECVRYDAGIKGKWGDIAARIISADIGLPMGYVDMNGNTHASVNPDTEVEGSAIFALVREGNLRTSGEVSRILSSVGNTPAASAGGRGRRGLHRSHGQPLVYGGYRA
jgi:voltage-gated potassium channel